MVGQPGRNTHIAVSLLPVTAVEPMRPCRDTLRGLAWHTNCFIQGEEAVFQMEVAMSNHDPERRLLLGRMLSFGAALSVFPVVSAHGNDTASGGQLGAAETKVPKAQVKYQEQPNGDQKCVNCAHFESLSGSCKLVQGVISQDAWCLLWSEAT
jgi:hypothetical protein